MLYLSQIKGVKLGGNIKLLIALLAGPLPMGAGSKFM